MDYQKTYNSLIRKAQTRDRLTIRREIHHILPRSMGGSDDPTNLVELTLREHFVAHLLLFRITGGTQHHYKMAHALFMMSNLSKYEGTVSSRTFASLKGSLGDQEIYTISHHDGRELSGTRSELKCTIDELSTTHIHNIAQHPGATRHGWSLVGADPLIRCHRDQTVYRITHQDGREANGRRYELSHLLASSELAYITANPGSERQGWRVSGSTSIDRHNVVSDEYTFVHKMGMRFVGTPSGMKRGHLLSHTEVNNMINVGGTAKGWFVEGTNPKIDVTVYSFTHATNPVFTGTKYAFANQHNLSVYQSTEIVGGKTRKGWRLDH